MASSPYIPNQLKAYIRKFELQQFINSSVNELLRQQPEDPFGYLIGIMQGKASTEIEIKDIRAYEVVSGEGYPLVKLHVQVVYLNKSVEFVLGEPQGILHDEAVSYEADRMGGKGLGKSVRIVNEQIMGKIAGYKCSAQQQIDKILQNVYQELGPSSLYAVNSVSFGLGRIQAHVLSQPLYKIVASLAELQPKTPTSLNLMVNCLQGGKAIGSKCKVYKYSIVAKDGCKDPFVAQSILAAIRKTIVGGKGGEAALKYSPDGCFVCPMDTIMDNLKIVQEAINACNARQQFGIGLSWAADSLFSPETKKYELENPKAPFDNDQMVDYLVKLLTDKPIIVYLQDPLAATELTAWKKLKTKITDMEALRHVKLGTRNQKFFNLLAVPFADEPIKTALQNLSVPATADSHPGLTQQQRGQTNAIKFTLDFVQCRAFQLKTLSNIIRLAKIFSKTHTRLILQDNLYESYDSSLVDVCYGVDAVLSLSIINGGKYDRVAKLNRIKEIQMIG